MIKDITNRSGASIRVRGLTGQRYTRYMRHLPRPLRSTNPDIPMRNGRTDASVTQARITTSSRMFNINIMLAKLESKHFGCWKKTITQLTQNTEYLSTCAFSRENTSETSRLGLPSRSTRLINGLGSPCLDASRHSLYVLRHVMVMTTRSADTAHTHMTMSTTAVFSSGSCVVVAPPRRTYLRL